MYNPNICVGLLHSIFNSSEEKSRANEKPKHFSYQHSSAQAVCYFVSKTTNVFQNRSLETANNESFSDLESNSVKSKQVCIFIPDPSKPVTLRSIFPSEKSSH